MFLVKMCNQHRQKTALEFVEGNDGVLEENLQTGGSLQTASYKILRMLKTRRSLKFFLPKIPFLLPHSHQNQRTPPNGEVDLTKLNSRSSKLTCSEMDRDRQRPEMYGDFSDSHRNSHSSTSSWSSDDPPPPPLPPHQALNSDAHRAGYSGDGDYHHRPHHHQTHRHHSDQRYNHQPNFNSEQHGPVPGTGPDDNPAHFGRKRPFLSSGAPYTRFLSSISFFLLSK